MLYVPQDSCNPTGQQLGLSDFLVGLAALLKSRKLKACCQAEALLLVMVPGYAN